MGQIIQNDRYLHLKNTSPQKRRNPSCFLVLCFVFSSLFIISHFLFLIIQNDRYLQIYRSLYRIFFLLFFTFFLLCVVVFHFFFIPRLCHPSFLLITFLLLHLLILLSYISILFFQVSVQLLITMCIINYLIIISVIYLCIGIRSWEVIEIQQQYRSSMMAFKTII